MTSFDVRTTSAVMKRVEQLKRWEESDTNREPPTPRPEKGRRIKFSSGCIFLAACLSGDKEEVIKLLDSGADINTANVDGLTALHQACIDDNLDMVEFLVEHGADINRQDNEGWTPLHATASCGFVSIARYLVENEADVSAVNSDGDLAVDLAVDIQHLGMIDFMQKVVAEHNIDCEKARQAEEQQMLNDAKRWLRSDASEVDRPHPKTGATALHVAAAKGYTKVLSLLLAGRANVDKQDNDGWTPLHAAAHWSQKEAAEMLVDAMADMDVRNYAGQSCIDVAERKMVKFLEELRANNKRMKRRPSSQISSRISDTIENHIENTAAKLVRVEVRPDPSKEQANVPQHVIKRENDSCSDQEFEDDTVGDGGVCDDGVDGGDECDAVAGDCDDADDDGGGGGGDGDGNCSSKHKNLTKIAESDETDSELTDSTESSHSTSISEAEDEKINLLTDSYNNQAQQHNKETSASEEEAPWRRNSSTTRARILPENPAKNQVPEKDVKNSTTSTEPSDVILRRTQSFENDEKFYQKYNELRARIKANSCPILPATLTNNNPSVLGTVNTTNQNYSVQRSASLKDQRNFRKPATIPTTASSAAAPTTTTNAVTVATTTITPVRRSFVPPVRDEESETQRKAHAKRVRETRRSTQGVTLDEIKSAEELVKKKNSTMNNNNNNNNNNNSSSFKLEDVSSGTTFSPTNSAIIPSAPAVIAAANLSSSVAQRRINSTGNAINSSTQSLNSIGRPVSAPITVSAASSTTNIGDTHINDRNSDSSSSIGSYAARRLNAMTSTSSIPTTSTTLSNTTTASVSIGTIVPPPVSSLAKSGEDKENDKENDNRSSLTTQAVLQRRRKPKRRSTGVVHLDMDDLDPERQETNTESEEKESGSERVSRSRLGSTSSSIAAASATDDNKSRERSENGGDLIDYKALWEAAKLENEKLKTQLKKKDDEVVQSRATLERITNATTKNSLSEIEKRERRAMERKLSEMEEELKLLQKLKTENERLRAENRALTRVVSKLTTSAQSQLKKTTNK